MVRNSVIIYLTSMILSLIFTWFEVYSWVIVTLMQLRNEPADYFQGPCFCPDQHWAFGWEWHLHRPIFHFCSLWFHSGPGVFPFPLCVSRCCWVCSDRMQFLICNILERWLGTGHFILFCLGANKNIVQFMLSRDCIALCCVESIV